MSYLSPLFTKKRIPLVFVIAIAILLAASLSQKVESAGDKLRASTQTKGRASTINQEDQATKSRRFPNLDVRATEPKMMAEIAAANASSISQRLQARKTSVEQGLARLRTFSRGAQAKSSPLTGAVEVLRSTTGALSGPAPGRNGADIVRSFITANSDVYGLSSKDIGSLRFLGESVSGGNGMRMVRVEQTVNGLSVFQSETRFILDSQGRVFRSTGLIIPSIKADPIEFESLMSAQAAMSIAMGSINLQTDTDQATITNANVDGTEVEVVSNNPNIAGNVTSKLVYFPLAPGILVPAWSQVTFTESNGDWYTLVDASSGKLLWRKDIRANVSTHDARFRVYVQADGTTPADSPAPLSPSNATVGGNVQPAGIAPTIVSMFTAMSATASPNGWIDDCPGGVCTAAQTQTIGNNVHAYMDRVGGAGAGGANQPDTAASSVLDGDGQADRGNRERPAEGFQKHWLPNPYRYGSLPPRRTRLYETLTPKSRAMPRSPDAYPCPTARNFHSPW